MPDQRPGPVHASCGKEESSGSPSTRARTWSACTPCMPPLLKWGKEKHKHNSDERNHNSHTKTASQTRRARLIGCDGRLRRTCCLGTLKPACLLGLFCFTPSNLFWRRRWRRLVLCGSARKKKQKKGPQSPTDVHLKIKRKRCKNKTTNTAGLAWGWVWLLAACTAHLWLLFSLCTTERSARNGHECRDKERVWEKVRHSFTQQQAKKKCKSETKQKDKKKTQTQRQKSFVQLECG